MILPATPLLVPGVTPGLRTDPLADLRGAVASALAALTAGGALPLVLAHGAVLRHGHLRPTLAGSGIGDHWLPDPSTGPGRRPRTGPEQWAGRARPPAGTGASVALLALADVLGVRAADVETLEVPPSTVALDGGPLELLRRADGLVVAGGGAPGGLDSSPDALTDGIRAALRAAGADGWTAEVQVFEQRHDHLPPEYRVTTLSDRKIAAC
ncbi:hypothetical protein [Promicromonospora umidemergens]|uniref:Uncharacterized protein n=1 Tax=Promicromonospora umidemergens TaxID=629679 RepID=A0ABP8XGE9_9MICO|nr:hypothetical protein [Promicromonospora umidemergens]